MIKGLLRTIRQKPKSARDGIALGVAAAFSFMVFSVWAFNMPSRMAAIEESYAENPEEDSGIGSFFSGVRDQVASTIESLDISTSTNEIAAEEGSTVVIPSVEEVVENLSRGNFATQTTETIEVEESGSGSSGREVRIVTTKATSSASSTAP